MQEKIYSDEELEAFSIYDAKLLKDGTQAGLTSFMFTVAIVADIQPWGYIKRYCYHNPFQARQALAKWDGTGDPEGWHRKLIAGEKPISIGKDGVRYE